MVRWNQSSDKKLRATARLWAIYVPAVYRYVVCRVNDAGAAEMITLNIIRKVIIEQTCYDNDERMAVPVFREARKQVREYLIHGDGNRRFNGLTMLEQDVLALRIGARLPADNVGKITGQPVAKIRNIVCESLLKIRDSGDLCR